MDPVQHADVDAEIIQHRDVCQREYDSYAACMRQANADPLHILSLNIDFMSDCPFPHVPGCSTSFCSNARWTMKTLGLIDHSHKMKMIYIFPDGTWAHMNNVVCTIITDYIHKVCKEKKIHPDILYLQFDNCVSQNKNETVFACCAMMLTMGWFKDIYISFMLPGHTKSDADQMFSIAKAGIYRHSFLTFDEAQALLQRLYHAGTKVSGWMTDIHQVHLVWDWSSMLTGYMNTLQGYQPFHAFHIHATPSPHDPEVSIIVMGYRQLWSAGEWEPQPIPILEKAPYCTPPVLQPMCFAQHAHIDALLRDSTEYFQSKPQVVAWWRRVHSDFTTALHYNVHEPWQEQVLEGTSWEV